VADDEVRRVAGEFGALAVAIAARCAADMANSILICIRKGLSVSPVGLPWRSK